MFEQPIKNIRRLREVIQVLSKYGFEGIVTETPLRKIVPEQTRLTWTRRDRSIFEYARAERIRMAVEELGATFMKLAQVLSNRPDLIPEDLIREFQRLQSDAEPFSSTTAKQIVEEELGHPIDAVFSFFDTRTLGAASIGQVHRARLRSGEEVIVKVRRPGIQDRIASDLDIIKQIVRRTENYLASLGIINPMDIVEAFEKSMSKELDYRNEARNVEQFRNFYQSNDDFIVPKAYKRLSTEKVLVMEFASGCKITDMRRLKEWGLDPRKIAEKGLDIYLKQIFESGYFHADPHPGNVLVRPDGRLVLIDFGATGRLLQKDKFALAGIFFNLARQSPKGVANNLRKLSIEGEIEDMKALEYDVSEFIEDFADLDVEDVDVGALASRLQQIIFQHRIRVHGSVFLILRALAILDGIGKIVHPEFNALEFIQPYGRKILQEQFSPENIGIELFYVSSQLLSFLHTFPADIRSILRKIRTGKMLIQIEHKGYEGITRKMELVSNKLSFALIICGLLIAASIAMSNPNLPVEATYTGLPYIALIEFSIAIFLGVLFILTVLRGSGKKNGKSRRGD